MRRMHEHFRTPYIGIWLFWRPALIVNSPEIARRVLVKDAGSFRNTLVGSGDSDPLGKLNLFTIKEKLYKELVEAKKLNGSDDFTSEQLAEMTYLNCVIKEVLRKHTIQWLDRVVTTDYQIDDQLTIAAGTPVYINTMGMHYNPEYFYDPEKFDPDRFLPENEKYIKPYIFLPFSDGPRTCIGQRFALISVRYAIVAVILNYKVQPFPNTPKPEDVVIEKRGAFYSPREPICVEFVPRT